jgi:DNA-binding transcriptional regulator of glucitol operon
MTDKPQENQAIPDQLMQIAQEQEGGAERVLGQIEVVQHSFEEIQNLSKECQDILRSIVPPSDELETLTAKLEEIGFHADNGAYNIQGAFDLYQYQDVVRQKLERVGRSLIEVSHYVLARLQPMEEHLPSMAPSGRDILHREPQMADVTKADADSVVAEFFAKALAEKAAKKAEGK